MLRSMYVAMEEEDNAVNFMIIDDDIRGGFDCFLVWSYRQLVIATIYLRGGLGAGFSVW